MIREMLFEGLKRANVYKFCPGKKMDQWHVHIGPLVGLPMKNALYNLRAFAP